MSIASDIQAVETKIKTEVEGLGSKLDSFLKADIVPLADQTIQDLEAQAGPILQAAWAQVLAMISSEIANAAKSKTS